ncbi:MAG: DUF4157 domain-containing protein [Deltaproteobacteria bacterium]|nr:DUF4157 domain-containing protein [Deltaproteobacteria bacterium]
MSAFGMGGGGGGGAVQRKEAPDGRASESESSAGTPGKGGGAVQLKGDGPSAAGDVHATAAAGVSGGGSSMPFMSQIQSSFGEHDISGVQAHTGAAAAHANEALGANAYATGENVAFGGTPDLHTAAHEAAHVVQQRAGVSLAGGVGQVGDQYEQHADAVADEVVAGRDASPLLSQMSGASSSASSSVQAKAIQFDIKADLRKAMEGWGTDEAAIFDRLKRASIAEIDAVVADKKLLDELQDELSVSEMERVLDMINAPLEKKIRVAMSGWFSNDNAYIKKSMDRATPEELQRVGKDAALVRAMIKTLSTAFLKSCLDRLQVPLATKLEYAMSGWGADEAYFTDAIGKASGADVIAISNNPGLMARIDSEGLGHLRGLIARKITQGGGSADDAFKVLVTENDAKLQQRLDDYGAIKEQRTMLDGVIVAGVDAIRVQRAFAMYWNVQVTSAAAVAATTNGGDNGAPSPAVAARNWPINLLQAIHTEMKNLPDQDSRSGVWNRLSLTNQGNLINRAAYGGGNFTVGSNASTGDPAGNNGGYAVTLTAAAAAGQKNVVVDEPTRFHIGDALALDRGGADAENVTVKNITGNTYEMENNLAKDHGRGTVLDPTDGSGRRKINWLNATVRHEIAHSLDGGGCDTKGFYAKGGWVLGSGDSGFDTWVTAMGGESAWTPNDGTKISDADRAKIKATIVDHVTNQKKSMFAVLPATDPVMVNKDKKVGVIDAAEQCLALGDNFYSQPTKLHQANGLRFSISFWYKRFQHHNEAVVSDRVADYGLYAPTEFFAEAYTVFYEEAGKPTTTDADLGRLVRNGDWRQWIRDHVHNRGMAPAGTGAAAPSTPGEAPSAQTEEAGARPGGASRGRAAGDPGM